MSKKHPVKSTRSSAPTTQSSARTTQSAAQTAATMRPDERARPGDTGAGPATQAGSAGDTGPQAMPGTSAETRVHMIAEAAYYLSEQRGFAPGHEVEDWLAAEQQIDSRIERVAV